MKPNELRRLFTDPPTDFGPTPFWSVNGTMSEEELGGSLRDLKAKGFAGVIIHPRTGLEVEYLSPEYWKGMDYIVRTLEELDMKGWLYDDYNWPSGAVGGKLFRERPDFRQRGLAYKHIDRGMGVELDGPLVAAFDVDNHYHPLTEQEGLKTYIPPDGVRRSLVFYEDPMIESTFVSTCAPWTREEVGAFDYMNAEAVERFIELTHDEYARRYAKHFGQTILGLFTDEPQNHHGFMWTGDLLDQFAKRTGYGLKPQLYRLVVDSDESASTRVDYYRVAASLYRERYFERVGNWCDKHGLIFTGHLSQEDSPSTLPANHASLFLPLSEMQMPGVDWLGIGYGQSGRPTLAQASNMNPKTVASVARLMKRERTLVEIWGGGGWAASPRTMKRSLDWLFALGVNFINPHLVLISLKGHRKRDFPPTFTKATPWWEMAGEFSKYIARLSWLLSRGTNCAKTLLLFPTVSMWALHKGRGDRPADYDAAVKQLVDATDALVSAHYDFDYLFEEALEKYALADGKIEAGVGSYETLIVPPLPRLDPATKAWIAKTREAGINIVEYYSSAEMISRLETTSPSSISIKGDQPKKIVAQHRRIGDADVFFMANLSSKPNRAIVRLRGTSCKGIEAWNPDDGSIRRLDNVSIGADASFDYTFPGGSSIVFFCSPDTPTGAAKAVAKTKIIEIELRGFVGIPVDKNLLLLEPWRVDTKPREIRSFNRMRRDKRYTDRTKTLLAVGRPIVAALNSILAPAQHYRFERFFPFGEGERIKPFAEKILGINFDKMALYESMDYLSSMIEYLPVVSFAGAQFPNAGEKYSMTSTFDLLGAPTDLDLIFEDVGEPVIVKINGVEARPPRPIDVWDPCNRAVDIKPLVKIGRNEVFIESRLPSTPAKFPCLHAIELVALRGDFVATKRGIEPGVAVVPGIGGWTRRGLPNYNGEVQYTGKFDVAGKVGRTTLDLGVVREAVEVLVNGESVGAKLWPPYSFDLSDAVKSGANALDIRVRATAANLFAKPQPSGVIGPVNLTMET